MKKFLLLCSLCLMVIISQTFSAHAAPLQLDSGTVEQTISQDTISQDNASAVQPATDPVTSIIVTADQPTNLLSLALIVGAMVTMYLTKTLKNLQYWQSTLLGLAGTVALGIIRFWGEGKLDNIQLKDLPPLLLPLIWGWVSTWINQRSAQQTG